MGHAFASEESGTDVQNGAWKAAGGKQLLIPFLLPSIPGQLDLRTYL